MLVRRQSLQVFLSVLEWELGLLSQVVLVYDRGHGDSFDHFLPDRSIYVFLQVNDLRGPLVADE